MDIRYSYYVVVATRHLYKTDCQYSTKSNQVDRILRIQQVHFGIPVGIIEPVRKKG